MSSKVSFIAPTDPARALRARLASSLAAAPRLMRMKAEFSGPANAPRSERSSGASIRTHSIGSDSCVGRRPMPSRNTWTRIEVSPDIVLSVRGAGGEDDYLVEQVRMAMLELLARRGG